MSLIAAALAGAALWSLAEYLIHRFLFHGGKRWLRIVAKEHLEHHRLTHWFAPASLKAAVAVPVVAALGAFGTWVGGIHGAAFTAGFLGFYLIYELIHRRVHTHAPANFYGRMIRKHHLHHHYVDPRMNHGLTSRFWDRVFGTLADPDVVPVPDKKATTWLTENFGRDGAPDWMRDYVKVQSGGQVSPTP